MRALYNPSRPTFARNVGVAPGTITLKLGGLGEVIAPDPPGWYTTLQYMPEYGGAPATSVLVPATAAPMIPAGTTPVPRTYYDPYQDIASLKGLGSMPGIGSPPGELHVWQGNPTTQGKIAAQRRAYQILNQAPLGNLGVTSSFPWVATLIGGGAVLLFKAFTGLRKKRS